MDLLRSMTDAVAHRGPDGEGTTIIATEGQPPTGLGHRRLAIIDLSAAGLQPMSVAADPGVEADGVAARSAGGRAGG